MGWAFADSQVKSISISQKSIQLGPLTLASDQPWPWQQIRSQLGTASRDLPLANLVHIYDLGGLAFYQPTEGNRTKLVDEIQIYWVPESIQVSPKSAFHGKLLLEEQIVEPSNTSPQQLGNFLKGWKAGKSYSSDSFRFECPRLYLYCQFDKSQKKLLRLTVGDLQASLQETFSK